MTYSIKDIIKIINGKLHNQTLFDHQIERILFDSRHLVFPANTLFFAFKSKRQDGHSFIGELYQQGVKNFIITNRINIHSFPAANFILVENTIRALQKLAVFHRKKFNLPVIGITGSNGKTIIKEWLFQLLQDNFKIIRSPASFNSQIGVPLSIWQIQQDHNLGIFEAGISQKGEMKNIAPIIDCKIGLLTNIGDAHSEGFTSKKEKLLEKLQLFQKSDVVIYNRDNDLIDQAFSTLKNKRHFTWAFDKKADIQITSIEKKSVETIISITFRGETFSYSIPFTDNASIENSIHCCTILLFFNCPFSFIQRKMPFLESVAMRLELKEGADNCTIINDSYSADLTSLELALNFAVNRTGNKELVLILSDILQSGYTPKDLYQRVARIILVKKVTRLIAIGKDISLIKDFLPPGFKVDLFQNTTTFLQKFSLFNFQNKTILLKGARTYRFETIVRRFEKKVHQTIMEVDLSAIAHNLKTYSTFLGSNTKLMAMVKASAYGSGSVEVAKILEFYKVDYLAVAYTDEGIELRKAGIQLPIIVLNPEKASFEALISYQLEPEIYSIELLKNLLLYLPDQGSLNIHLKLDTGMHRLGFEKKDLPDLVKTLTKHPSFVVKSIFSHLAASDLKEHDQFTEKQIMLFQEMYHIISLKLNYKPLRHILNSSGIIRFPQYKFEMVRLGIGLYGIDGSRLIQSQLKVVNTLKTTISQIKKVEKQETVGYNRSGKIDQQKKIATINIGYADGLTRKTGNGNYAVSVKGKKAFIIGNVCMDMCMIDITHIDDAKIGDEVIIFGQNPSVTELANCLETIPYEIFTGISSRVKRIYFRS